MWFSQLLLRHVQLEHILRKATILCRLAANTVDESSDSVTLAEFLCDSLANLDNFSSVITTDGSVLLRQVVDVLEVSGVEADCVDLDKDVVVAELGNGSVNEGSFALLLDLDGLHAGWYGHFEMSMIDCIMLGGDCNADFGYADVSYRDRKIEC